MKIKINNKLKYLFLAAPFFFATSCKKDFLNTAPDTALPIEDAFANPDRILSQVNGVYAGIKNGQYYGGRFLIYNDIRGEEFIVNKPNGVTGLDTWRFNVTSGTNEVVNLWGAVYAAINRANLVIEGVTANSSLLTPTLTKQYIAEAKFCRAFCYYSLLQLYAKPYITDNGASLGVPLRLKGEKDLTGNDLKRSTVAEVYTQILKDLNEAEPDLALTLAATRASRNTAIAFKTRVYLSMGNLSSVVTEANKIVSATAPFVAATGSPLKLEANITTVFGGAYTGNATATEAALSFPMADLDAPGTQNQLAYYYNVSPNQAGGNEEFFLNPTGIFGNAAFAAGSTDARKSLTTVSGANTYLSKFKRPSPYTDYVPAIRYAEVLLNLAEATVVTDPARSIALLTAVRQRSNPTYVFPAADLLPANLKNTILTERRIELLGEGLRSPDIMRLGLGFPAKSGSQGTAPAIPFNTAGYVWPISANEVQNNKLIVQN
ncbi:RagB/SusD family nutrient uptake outer membrane protein [Pedobacter frigidisoli]|uniref:RagB/SusD family nutrient uptake outer membrane protein n=1 Tax=Pedobacter frigidisoli TaxID=2530455 RepID=A0A4R0NHT3_9SPHI|nr:RagB/SusD family nutrient uptake outer membrane protein [Pedobacter frigidisoli]TCD00036.1 RagB/SusD family nutrient uptake outer membrane protein [Pedobacter frigidisoli]